MLSPRGQTVLEAEILSSASTSCPRPHPRASGLGMSSDFVTWPRAYVYFTTKPKPMICIRQYVPCHPSTSLLFTAIYLLVLFGVCLLPVTVTLLCHDGILKLKKNCPRPRDFVLGLGLVVLSSALSSSSGFCPRPRPQEFGLDQHHCC